MARARKTKEDIARDAQRRHEEMAARVKRDAGRPGITKRRLRLQDALLERMRAEQRAGMV